MSPRIFAKLARDLAFANAIKQETTRIGSGKDHHLRIGYLNVFNGQALNQAISEFAEIYPDVHITVTGGTHEELYYGLRDHEQVRFPKICGS